MNNKPTDLLSQENSLLDDDRWIGEALKSHLDSKVDSLDFNVVSKLSSARHRAMALQTSSSRKDNGFGKWFTRPAQFSAVAVVALSVFLGSQFLIEPTEVPAEQLAQLTHSDLIADLNILSANEDLEFFQTMEFLEWMASN